MSNFRTEYTLPMAPHSCKKMVKRSIIALYCIVSSIYLTGQNTSIDNSKAVVPVFINRIEANTPIFTDSITRTAQALPNSHHSNSITSFNPGIISDPFLLVQGRVPGTSIYNRGGDPNQPSIVRVRGLSGGAPRQPLVVIDGILGLSIDLVDPQEITSIQILRTASSQAIYGIRGTDGVVLINTINPKWKRDTMTVLYRSLISFSQIANKDPLLNSDEFKRQGGLNLGGSTDWVDEITRQSISHSQGISILGRKGKTNYRLSGNYRFNQGILKSSNQETINLRLSANSLFLKDRLSVSFQSSLSYRDKDLGFSEAFRYATSFSPTASVDASGLPFAYESEVYGGYFQFLGLFDTYNPLSIVDLNQRKKKSDSNYGSLHLSYELLDQLQINIRHSVQNRFSNHRSFYSPSSLYDISGSFGEGGALLQDIDDDFSLTEIFAQYSNSFKQNELNLTIGSSFQDGRFDERRIQLSNISEPSIIERKRIGSIDDFPNNAMIVDSAVAGWNNDIQSFYTTAELQVGSSFNFHSSMRLDGSSKLGANNKWGLFYSAGANTDLLSLLNWQDLNLFVFSANYGVTGGLPEQGGLSSSRFQIFNQERIQKMGANPDLKWESKKELNLGLTLKKNNFNFRVDWYSKQMSDWISIDRTDALPFYANGLGMSSSGLDVSFGFEFSNDSNRKLTTSGYISFIHSKLNNVPNQLNVQNCSCGPGPLPAIVFQDDAPIGQIYAPQFSGLVALDGFAIFNDVNRNGQSEISNEFIGQDGDLVNWGSGIPTAEIGWNLLYKVNNWAFSSLFRGAFGHVLANRKRQIHELYPNPDRPILLNSIETNLRVDDLQFSRFSSLYVESADFIKWDNLTVSREFVFSKSSGLKNLRLSFTVNNLMTFSNYSGLNPEPVLQDREVRNDEFAPSSINRNSSNIFLPGIDRRSSYIPSRSFILSAEASF